MSGSYYEPCNEFFNVAIEVGLDRTQAKFDLTKPKLASKRPVSGSYYVKLFFSILLLRWAEMERERENTFFPDLSVVSIHQLIPAVLLSMETVLGEA